MKIGTNYLRLGRILLLLVTAFILGATGARPACAQDASLAGTVRDVTGAAIAGATVHIESLETGKQRELHTDDAGRFTAAALAVGQYDLTVDKAGFRGERRTGLVLVVGEHGELDLTLQVEDVHQFVEVSADPIELSATTDDTSGLVGERQVKDLPLNGRSYIDLLTIQPGVAPESSATGLISVNGQREASNTALSSSTRNVTSPPFLKTAEMMRVSATIHWK